MSYIFIEVATEPSDILINDPRQDAARGANKVPNSMKEPDHYFTRPSVLRAACSPPIYPLGPPPNGLASGLGTRGRGREGRRME